MVVFYWFLGVFAFVYCEFFFEDEGNCYIGDKKVNILNVEYKKYIKYSNEKTVVSVYFYKSGQNFRTVLIIVKKFGYLKKKLYICSDEL